ncbi:DUF4397 domain-containing protein [Nocardioides anomalus]|uniref:DUF4397 domain-containing protein n=1 Tax=Nocardioides anomalus TaxID=2712223 RepID=A0A6G6WCH9_9ACTN|nr:DUF4397 domain-containing protein [Nocardioides anomalus]QIG42934.1 DUF4397 domain-containing protein [Nocardioides anomalus]
MPTRIIRAVSAAAALTVAGAVATVSFASDAQEAAPRAQTPAKAAVGQVALIQAVPQVQLTVTVDGQPVRKDVAEGTVVGPLELAVGSHQVSFTDGKQTIDSTVDVSAGQASDVVVHRPAEVGGQPVVSVYPTPSDPIDPGKARVLLAHTATTAPADVVVDGQTVFTNIANGEFAQADVAAGAHVVSLLPAGIKADPILGPLDVDLEPGTITAVYAVGNPKDGSMNVITRTTGGTASASQAPSQIDTGSAGLVDRVRVWTFSGR